MNKLLKILLVGQACIWVTFGVLTYIKTPTSIIMPLFMLVGALGFIFVLITFNKNTFFNVIGLMYIVLNLILTVTDEFGLFDTIILVVNILTIISVIYIITGEKNAKFKK